MKAEDLSNEDLATMLRSMCTTGICPSGDEKEYLQEAADRLEQKPICIGKIEFDEDKLKEIVHDAVLKIQEPCEDVISRESVINVINSNAIWENEYNLTASRIKELVKALPSVTPRGHWLRVTTVKPKEFCNRCSECGYEQFYAERYKFCPNCGCHMVEPQESEDKE